MRPYRLPLSIGILWLVFYAAGVDGQGAFVWTTYTEVKPVLCLAVDQDDKVWAGTPAGLSRFGGMAWRTYTRADGLPADEVRDLYTDRHGNVWAATRNGAVRLDGQVWTTFTVEDGLGGNKLNAIAEDLEGNIWFGTEGSGATRFDGEEWVTYSEIWQLPSRYVQCLAVDESGGIWFGTFGGASWSDGTEWRIYTKQDGLVHPDIRCVALDAFGSAWFGTPEGISVFEGMRWIRYGKEHGVLDNRVLCLYVDGRGYVWAGTPEGVSRFDGRSWTSYTKEDGLGEGSVRAIVEDAQGTLWFGTEEGMTSLERRAGIGKFVHILGRGGRAWEDAGEGVNLDFDAEPGVLCPRRLKATDNLTQWALAWGGKIWSSSAEDDPQGLRRLIDGSLYSGYEKAIKGPRTVYIDLGGTFPIRMIEVYPGEGEFPPLQDQLPQQMAVGLIDQDPHQVMRHGGLPDLQMFWRRTIDGVSPVQVSLPPAGVYARYVGVEVSRTEVLRLFEIKVYDHDSYLPEASYVSDVIDLWDIASWGQIRWRGEKPPEAEVLVRTRSGVDDDPNVYWRYIPGTDHQTPLTPEGMPLTRADHEKLADYLKGQITWDEENWSSWSAPYSWEEGKEGVPVVSPGPRRYFQVRADFVSTAEQAGRLDDLSFEYSQPPSAHQVFAEIFPTEVKAAARTTFTYAVRPRIGGDDTGFDSLEIFTPVPVDRVRSVKIDGRDVPFTVEVLEGPPRFIVHFPEARMDVSDDNGLLEVTFDCVVYRYGTAFEGRVFDSVLGQAHQRVTPGNAKEQFLDDETSVRIDLSSPLIAFVHTEPDPFTPNGDGANDEVSLLYGISKVTQPISVEVDLYDLSGVRVRRGYAGEGGIGSYEWKWDGRDDNGKLLPPGVYVYRITIYPDIGLSAAMGTVHLVY